MTNYIDMIKNSVFLLFFLLFHLLGYGQKYSIHGVLPDDSFNGKYVVLVKAYFKFFEEPVIIDSVKIKNREFTFKGKVNEEPFLANLFAGHTELGEFVMEPGHIRLLKRAIKS